MSKKTGYVSSRQTNISHLRWKRNSSSSKVPFNLDDFKFPGGYQQQPQWPSLPPIDLRPGNRATCEKNQFPRYESLDTNGVAMPPYWCKHFVFFWISSVDGGGSLKIYKRSGTSGTSWHHQLLPCVESATLFLQNKKWRCMKVSLIFGCLYQDYIIFRNLRFYIFLNVFKYWKFSVAFFGIFPDFLNMS